MIDLDYSLIIEATMDPEYFSFYSSELEGFTGSGSSIEDCINKAREGMREHVELMKEKGFTLPKFDPNPSITIVNAKGLRKAV